MSATAGIGEHPLALFDHAIALLRVAILLAVWRSLIGPGETVAGFTGASILTYTVISNAFGQQLDVRSSVLMGIHEGAVATRMLRPVGTFADYAAEMFGTWSLRIVLFSAPLLVVSPLFGISVSPASAGRGAAFILSLVLSIAVGLAIDFLIGLLTLKFVQSLWAIEYARNGIIFFLAGTLIPLPLLPFGMGAILQWLPFASMGSAPLLIYTGQGNVAGLLALQGAWAAALWVVTPLLWNRGRNLMVSFGG